MTSMHRTTNPSSKDTLVTLLDRFHNLILKSATICHVDPDDLRQDVAVRMLEKWDDVAENPYTFMVATIRGKALSSRTANVQHESLDVPVHDGASAQKANTETLGDTLPAPSLTDCDPQKLHQITTGVHAALRCLPYEAQEYLASVHKLTAYTPQLPEGQRTPDYIRSIPSISSNAYRRLRRNKALKAVVEEVYA
jgi:hypothetical protein